MYNTKADSRHRTQ